ncbi:MAG: hypothetical protein BWK76_00005, partial [Desulfobulbaceae bacterium A2]
MGGQDGGGEGGDRGQDIGKKLGPAEWRGQRKEALLQEALCLMLSQKVFGMARQNVRYPRRGGVAQAEAYMRYVEHCAIPPQRGR